MSSGVLSPVFLSSFRLCRQPPRPIEDREPSYGAWYDFDTLFYDVFLSHDGRSIVAVSPPLLNCEAAVAAGTFRLHPGGEKLAPTLYSRSRSAVLRLALPPGAAPTTVTMEINGTALTVPVRPSGYDAFRGCKVIFAISKNNPLPWIADWATYNARVHGADAAILYDNSSVAYDVADIERTLRAIEGLQKILVLSWRFPFGPDRGPKGEYDSNYAQLAALEHARWRFAPEARAVLNSDIDEMVVTADGRSIFTHLAESELPCLTYLGHWVSIARPLWRRHASMVVGYREGHDLRHSDCLFVEDEPPYPTKWVADPRACDAAADWATHEVFGLTGPAEKASQRDDPIDPVTRYRHCRQVGLNWKYKRTGDLRYRIGLTYDRPFARALARAFPDRHIFRTSGSLLRRFTDFLRQF